MFTRKKSGPQAIHDGPQEEDTQHTPRVRNRLSKPRSLHHNLKTSSSLPRLDTQNAEVRSDFAVVEPTSQSASTDSPSTNPRVFDLISRIEANQRTSLPLSKPKDSFRASMTSIPETKTASLSTSPPKDRLTQLKNDSISSISPTPSLNDFSETPSFSRRSSFRPGAATRTSSFAEGIQEEQESDQTMHQDDGPEQKIIEDDARSFDEGDDEAWFPPPQIARPESPRSLLNYTTLGGLSLGSLQVVNGRVSPAPSNMSKQILLRQSAARETSSEYAESLYEDQSVPASLNGGSVYSTRNRYRDFSWQSHGSSKLRDSDVPPVPSTENSSEDPATFLASEYMAELPPSPYSVRKSSLANRTNFANRAAAAGLEHISQSERSPSVRSLMSCESADSEIERVESPVPSLRSETGTILITTTKRTENEDDLFEDEAIGRFSAGECETPELSHSADLVAGSVDNSERFESALDLVTGRQLTASELASEVQFTHATTAIHVDTKMLVPAQSADVHVRELDTHGFESALEFQSPLDLEPLYLSTPKSVSPEPRKSLHISDSGYSSNVSLRSSSAERKQSMTKSSAEVNRRSLVEKVLRPMLKSRRFSSDVLAPKNNRPSATRAATVDAATLESTTQQADIAKKSKRLTKRLPSAKFLLQQPVVMQTIESIDDLSIPPVSNQASENLRARVLAVPELETTYSSMDHVRNRLSMSTVDALDDFPEIRFPSPEPSPKQRRRSWFGKIKDEKPKPSSNKRNSRNVTDITQRHAMAIVNDWESIAPSLGGSHYDQIPSRRNSMKQQHLRQPRKLRQRSMMDDKTAAELARYRSASIRERDAWNESMSTEFRRSISGRNSRKSSLSKRMPLSSYPHSQSRGSSAARSSFEHHIPVPSNVPPPPPHSSRPASINEDTGSPPHPSHAPPPPPPHLPRPSSIHEDCFSSGIEDVGNDLVPPPPSHSPRPMDVTPEPEDPWAIQAQMWKTRREQVFNGSVHEYDHSDEGYDENVYPDIPPKPQQRYTIDGHGRSYDQGWNSYGDGYDGGYQQDHDYGYSYDVQHTPDHGYYSQQQGYSVHNGWGSAGYR